MIMFCWRLVGISALNYLVMNTDLVGKEFFWPADGTKTTGMENAAWE
jgi:hypothetical protein